MQLTRTSFLGLPRLTVRRMMVYVAVVALAIQVVRMAPACADAVHAHWTACERKGLYEQQMASTYRLMAARFPGDARRQAWEATAALCDARAQISERAKWRLCSEIPPGSPPPDLRVMNPQPEIRRCGGVLE